MSLKVNKDLRLDREDNRTGLHRHYEMTNDSGISEKECPVIYLSTRMPDIVQCNGMKDDKAFETMVGRIESDLDKSGADERPIYPVIIYNNKYADLIKNSSALLPDLSVAYSKDVLALIKHTVIGLQCLMDMTGYDGCLRLYTYGLSCDNIMTLYKKACKEKAGDIKYLIEHLVICGTARGAATYDKCKKLINQLYMPAH